jgi:transcription initiation factor TFIIH subunit 2
VAVCKTLVARTNPSLSPSTTYTVAMNEQHYRELILAATTPPPTSGSVSLEDAAAHNALLKMGFPSRTISHIPTFCACHSKPNRSGYLCPQCRSKVCALPSTCPACDLTLILSTHLARSYHHLFPLQNWSEVSWTQAAAREKEEGGSAGESSACFACLTPFPPLRDRPKSAKGKEKASDKGSMQRASHSQRPSHAQRPSSKAADSSGVSESGRYMCATCRRFFCIDCDVYAHEIIHNCPGCQSREGRLAPQAVGASEGAEEGAAEGDVIMAEGAAMAANGG